MSFSIEIASVPDRESWVAEIWWDDKLFAEISRQRDGTPLLEIYPRDGSGLWNFVLKAFAIALAEAQSKLGLNEG